MSRRAPLVLGGEINEDKLRARINNAVQQLAIMRRMVMNAPKEEKSKSSLKGKRQKACWPEKYLLKLFVEF